MADVRGYVLVLNEERWEVFEEAVNEYGRFAQAVDDFGYSQTKALPVFILGPAGRITHLGVGRKGARAGTEQRRLNVDGLTPFESEVTAASVMVCLSPRARRWADPVFRAGGVLSPAALEEVVDTLRALAPEMRSALDRYSRASQSRLNRLSTEVRAALAYQKDTIAVALNIAGIDRRPIADWAIGDDPPSSFLDGLKQTRLREDPMILHDMQHVPGFDGVRSAPVGGAAVFENERVRLTIVLANRQPLEELAGADLIYYNETFQAVVMIQYKAMEPDDANESIFRLPNAPLADEIERMDALIAHLNGCAVDATSAGYRLDQNPFYLKFCPRIQFNPYDAGMISGMYVPLPLWKRLENDPTLVGPKGGRSLTYRNVGRYLDNTGFAGLVASAWVGTTAPQSALISEWIRETLETGRAVTLAAEIRKPRPGFDDEPLQPDEART